MAEEHRCEAPENHRLCANNCGLIGSSTTMNLCSNCYTDFCIKQQQQHSSIKSPIESSLSPSPSPAADSITLLSDSIGRIEITGARDVAPVKNHPNRCSVCQKRVGLIGFKCRCGFTFCGSHRHPETHGCAFDFKTRGREEIVKANPLVKGDKLQKI